MLKVDVDSVIGEISGDESIPYENWHSYELAVKEGTEVKPQEIIIKGRPDYSFNVDKALDNIDLTFANYTPSRDAIDFFNIIRMVLGEDPEVDNSLMHYFLVDLVFGNIERNQYPYSKEIQDKIRINRKKIAVIASRFSAKSTILTAYLPIYLAIKGTMPNFGKVMFIVGFGDSQQAGARVMANAVRDFCQDSDFCKEYFEKMRFTDEECEFIRKGDGRIKDRSFMFKLKGAAGGSVRGIRYRTERPSMFFFDDIIKSEADASSDIIMKKLKSMIYADAENALGRKGMIIAVNTPFNKKDPIYSALESGIWTPICLPLCEHIDLDLKKEDYVASWEEMHDYEKTMERYLDAYYGGTLREFMQELMLRISSDEDRMITDGMIQWYRRTDLEHKLEEYNLYTTTDFTTTGGPKSDLSGAATWAVGSNSDYFMLDLALKQSELAEQYNELFRQTSYWGGKTGRAVSVGVEIDGQQKAHVFSLKEQMIRRNEWFIMARQKGSKVGSEGINSKAEGGNKHWRFRMTLPVWQNHKIWLPYELKDTPQMKELLEELKYVTYESFNSKYDDGMDLISMLTAMEILFPQAGQTFKPVKKAHQMWGFEEEDTTEISANAGY